MDTLSLSAADGGRFPRYLRAGQCKRFSRACSVAAVAAIATILTTAAIAHDFWIEPSTFRPQPGAKVPLSLRVGNDFNGEPVIFHPEYFNRYVVDGPDGERKVDGVLGDDPAGRIAPAKPGLYTVLYDSRKFDVTFDDFAKFEAYLREEGLERQLVIAKARGAGKVTEQYSRCAKALIAVGPAADANASDRYFKCALELVAENNPYALKGGGELRFRLRFRDQPVEGVLVVAFSKAEPGSKLSARTDREGRVTFNIPKSGVWLVKAVHMVVMPRLTRGDWESFWASLTFEVPRTL